MGLPAALSPDEPHPSNRRAVSFRLSFREFLLLLPFPSPFQLGSAAIGWLVRRGTLARLKPTEPRSVPTRLFVLFPKCFDLHVYTSWEIEFHESIDCLLRRLENVEQAL